MPLTLGCDCLGHIHYFDATLVNSKGQPVQVRGNTHAMTMTHTCYDKLVVKTQWLSSVAPRNGILPSSGTEYGAKAN